MSFSGSRFAPGWTGIVIGLLLGLLVGTVWLLLRDRDSRVSEADPVITTTTTPTPAVESGHEPAHQGEDESAASIGINRRNAIVTATERVAPAVVSINVVAHRIYSDPRREQWNQFFQRLFPQRSFGQDVRNYGSGFIVSSDGFVLTNFHVIQGADQITVTLSDGREFEAVIVEVVPSYDLALLRIPGEELPVVTLAPPDEMHIGEWAIAIGSPFGYLLADTQPTVTVGVISALNRDIRQSDEDRYYLGMIQTDAAINPGNSGGPLVNAAGEVIGINTFIFTESGGSIGIGFAVPTKRAQWLISEVRQHGRYRESYMGVVGNVINPNIAQNLGLKNPVGVMLRAVVEGSPAWKAGLRVGDVINELNGVPLHDGDTWDRLLYETQVGTVLTFVAERQGESFTGEVILEESPFTARQ